MKHQKVTLENFSIVGISIRTTNTEGQAAKDISQLWGRFFKEQILQRISNRASDDIYCIYTDYESDYRGKYTTILGCRVLDNENAVEGLTKIEIQQSEYLQFSAVGVENVGHVWKHVWETDYPRKYTADFDVYEAGESEMDKMRITTYLSVNK